MNKDKIVNNIKEKIPKTELTMYLSECIENLVEDLIENNSVKLTKIENGEGDIQNLFVRILYKSQFPESSKFDTQTNNYNDLILNRLLNNNFQISLKELNRESYSVYINISL